MSEIETIQLAPDFSICRILNGMWQVAGGHGQIDSQLAIQDMEKYQKLGFTTWDLADIYGPAESLIGDFNKKDKYKKTIVKKTQNQTKKSEVIKKKKKEALLMMLKLTPIKINARSLTMRRILHH